MVQQLISYYKFLSFISKKVLQVVDEHEVIVIKTLSGFLHLNLHLWLLGLNLSTANDQIIKNDYNIQQACLRGNYLYAISKVTCENLALR